MTEAVDGRAKPTQRDADYEASLFALVEELEEGG
jgi:hypothetical protein